MKNDEEIEVKFFVQDLAGIERRLQGLGARCVQARTLEVNLRFDLPDGSLGRDHRVLRLRQDTQTHLTYKGPGELRDGVRAREEIEFSVGDFAATQALLEALGFRVSVIYEKYRRVYALENAHIMLDEMPYGDFVEIEGPQAASIRENAGRLALDWEKRISGGYLALFETLRRKRELRFRDLTFESFDGITVRADDLQVAPADTPS
jgi:adenylate cyclase class 2